MHLFYATYVVDNTIELNSEESRHLTKVLRLSEGSEVVAIDGKGTWYNCTVSNANHKKSTLHIDNKKTSTEKFGVSIAAAPTKNINRWEWFLEKATELGIDEIHPIVTSNSERKVLKRDRQERILISAMKQSYKTYLPDLSDLTPLKELVKMPFSGKKYIAHCYADLDKKSLKTLHPKGEKALILIGPEGDFSREEVALAMQHDFEPVHLGENRLRTETAAIVACNTIHFINA